MKSTLTVGSSTAMPGSPSGVCGSQMVEPISMRSSAASRVAEVSSQARYCWKEAP